MTAAAWALAALAALGAQRDASVRPEVVVGSKGFTESVVLGEIATLVARDAGARVSHRRELGGTRVLWNALREGAVDVYPEYTGTLLGEVLADRTVRGTDELAAALLEDGVVLGPALGFENTYALGVRAQLARERSLRAISDLRSHPDLVLGFSNEFMGRADGWPGLRARYALPHPAEGIQHELAYRALESGALHVIDLYTTDAEIAYYGLVALDDDLGYFPEYQAVLLWRQDLEERAPRVVEALAGLGGRVSASAMIAMNARAKLDRVPESRVAADFLADLLARPVAARAEDRAALLARATLEHLRLVAVSLFAAIAVAIPLGVLAARRRSFGQAVLGATGLLQTVPSLAMFVFLIPLLGIGAPPAIAALFLYSLLPIVRNTHAGLVGIAPHLVDAARALGLPPAARLRRVELPLATPAILAGIQTSAVINVGTATLGALIGAGGYGQPILTGIRLDDTGLILLGAVPAAALALAVQGAFELLARVVVPRGLRLERQPS